ncbi:anti-sigma regulatory factor [Dyadobacter sp. LJ53]|uniref:anti-sigma regulatory factor n=1 Tax=Dyadobacter chenwenxiniae TaxID=2906456 RepID=UPI001F389D54|nr:anti-sigma regulatory factor [Dyadobacter chenwenxiniae]MCF0048703.1 anti-sigma regulatory factor [Dyadobacter chenwenxiniae]
MEQDSIRIHFTSNREEIPGILNTCLEHVVERTKASPPSADTFSKVKWVITELLTNAVKHSGTGHCTLIIKVDDGMLILEKQDMGKPLSVSEQDTGNIFTWPIESFSGKLEFQIYHNGVDSLIVRSEQGNRANFYIEELEGMEMPALLIDTSEHFGLLIITKASDAFSYEYDLKTKVNRFISLFNLKKH